MGINACANADNVEYNESAEVRMYGITDLFDLSHTQAKEYLAQYVYPWQALPTLKEFIIALGERLEGTEYVRLRDGVWAHKSARIAPTAQINAPCVIGAETEIRHGALIRGSALVGEGCVVGNSTEIKNAILFDGAQAPHYNYVGDSVLGYKAHMGAGAITSNVKAEKSCVYVQGGDKSIATGLKKVGAFLGDFAEVGCNSVLNPGAVIGKNSNVYPLSCVRGVVPPDSIYKKQNVIVDKR